MTRHIKTGHIKILLGAVSLVALTACERGALDSWNSPAGSFLDEGDFGNPTMNNHLVMTGERSYVVGLNERFAAAVPTTVNFAFNQATLLPEARAILDRQAHFIRQFPEVRFKVYGHTDLVGSNAYNRALGLRRAQAVVAYLTSRGISRSRLEAVVSYGETQPLVYTQQPEMKNRRTVTEVTGFVRNHPAVLNGKYAEVVFREYVESAQPRSTLGEFDVSTAE